jgi:AhpD family alkylhydroperoxidase
MGEVEENCASIYSDSVRELVAIGAAIAANCEPCFKFHFDKARKLGIAKSDMVKAVETAQMVKDASAKNVLDLADKFLESDRTPCNAKKACCS